MAQLQPAFRRVLADYFPRWHRGREWRIKADRRLRAHGYCYTDRKLILIGSNAVPISDSLDVLLIHEISHAVAGGGHGVRWQRRILAAADRAVARGNAELAERLRAEVEAYKDGLSRGVGTCHDCYATIEDWVLVDGISSWSDCRRGLIQEYAVIPARALLETYPRARRVFDAAIRKRTWDQEAQQAWGGIA